jgi:hypothetical protein
MLIHLVVALFIKKVGKKGMGKKKQVLCCFWQGFIQEHFKIISNRQKTTVLLENLKINISILRWDVVVV